MENLGYQTVFTYCKVVNCKKLGGQPCKVFTIPQATACNPKPDRFQCLCGCKLDRHQAIDLPVQQEITVPSGGANAKKMAEDLKSDKGRSSIASSYSSNSNSADVLFEDVDKKRKAAPSNSSTASKKTFKTVAGAAQKKSVESEEVIDLCDELLLEVSSRTGVPGMKPTPTCSPATCSTAHSPLTAVTTSNSTVYVGAVEVDVLASYWLNPRTKFAMRHAALYAGAPDAEEGQEGIIGTDVDRPTELIGLNGRQFDPRAGSDVIPQIVRIPNRYCFSCMTNLTVGVQFHCKGCNRWVRSDCSGYPDYIDDHPSADWHKYGTIWAAS